METDPVGINTKERGWKPVSNTAVCLLHRAKGELKGDEDGTPYPPPGYETSWLGSGGTLGDGTPGLWFVPETGGAPTCSWGVRAHQETRMSREPPDGNSNEATRPVGYLQQR